MPSSSLRIIGKSAISKSGAPTSALGMAYVSARRTTSRVPRSWSTGVSCHTHVEPGFVHPNHRSVSKPNTRKLVVSSLGTVIGAATSPTATCWNSSITISLLGLPWLSSRS